MSSATAFACLALPSARAFISATATCGPTDGIQQAVCVYGELCEHSQGKPTGGIKLMRPLVASTTCLRIARLANLADITVGALAATGPQNAAPKSKRNARGLA